MYEYILGNQVVLFHTFCTKIQRILLYVLVIHYLLFSYIHVRNFEAVINSSICIKGIRPYAYKQTVKIRTSACAEYVSTLTFSVRYLNAIKSTAGPSFLGIKPLPALQQM
jgi:hypothetical protein